MDPMQKFPCPCCGHLVHDRMPGHHEVCPICGWEDDLAQLRFPLMNGGANHVSLHTGQQNYAAVGAAEKKNRGLTRAPFEQERMDRAWRPLDIKRDNVEEPRRGENYAVTYPWRDTTVLYYWRDTYWRRYSS
jgi:hypothetical protein